MMTRAGIPMCAACSISISTSADGRAGRSGAGREAVPSSCTVHKETNTYNASLSFADCPIAAHLTATITVILGNDSCGANRCQRGKLCVVWSAGGVTLFQSRASLEQSMRVVDVGDEQQLACMSRRHVSVCSSLTNDVAVVPRLLTLAVSPG
jgi:hypothetical protein